MKVWWLVALGMAGVGGMSCAKSAAPHQAPGSVEQAPLTGASNNGLLQQLAAARNQAAVEPLSPAKHFRLLGKIIFHSANGPIEQAAELWLAGAQRMSFQVGQERQRNDFRLFDAEHCWLKKVSGPFEPYDAAELTTETMLRWEVLRFPWGWETQLALLTRPQSQDLRITLERATPFGPLVVETDGHGLPARAKLAGSSLTLGDWRSADEQQESMPHLWQWQYQAGKRTEQYDSIRARALFQDSAFRPVSEEKFPIGNLESAIPTSANLSDEFGVVETSLFYLEEKAHANFQGSLASGQWWQVGNERFFVANADEHLAAEWQHWPNTTWLRWSTYADIKTADGILSLTAVLEQMGYHATDACWALEAPAGKRSYRHVFLLPVAKD